jgi:sn-glycerol 3-phosphate transport system substrate-binding protein
MFKTKWLVLSLIMVLAVFGGTAAAQDDVIEIEFWSLLTGPLGERVQALVDDYNASQDAVRIVNVNQGGYNELQTKLLASVAAEEVPVVTMVDFQYVPFYANEGVFVPLNDLAGEGGLDDYIPGLLTDLSYNGEVYALPFNRSTQGMYFNRELFDQAGVDYPNPDSTWEEIAESARAISALGDDIYGIYGDWNTWYWQPFVQSWGGEFSDAECNYTFNSPEGVAAAEFFQGLIHDDEVAILPSNSSGTFDQQALEFVIGQVGMMRQSTAINGFIDDVVNFEWGFTMLPAGPGGRAVTSGGANFAISASAEPELQAAAFDFISFMTNTENTARFHMETGYMPSRFSALELPEVQEFHEANPSWRISVDQLEFVEPTSCATLNSPQYGSAGNEYLERIYLSNEDPQAVLDEAVAQLNAIIADSRETGEIIVPQ